MERVKSGQVCFVKEEQIRPTNLFQEFIRLTAWDAENFFDKASFVRVGCPLCGGGPENVDVLFNKFGFEYSACVDCKSWFASLRPPSSAITSWYSNSPGASFWATDFYPRTAEARRERLWRPKAKMLSTDFDERFGASYSLIDIGGGYGIFAEEFQDYSGRQVTVIEPGASLASKCASRGIKVIPKFLEEVADSDLPKGRKAFVCFELFEHLTEPRPFFLKLQQLMSPGDVAYFTTLSSGGVDIKQLGALSDAVSPPHHLLLANPAAISRFLRSIGFSPLEIITPGKLDVDILFQRQAHIQDGFWRDFLSVANEAQRYKMQDLVADSGLSSHMSFLFERTN